MSDAAPLRVAVVIGTRPEAIKMAPLMGLLRADPGVATTLVSTGQHREMLQGTLEAFGVAVDIDLGLMEPGQSLADLTARTIRAVDDVFDAAGTQPRFDWLLVQGDTTSAMAAGLAGFYRGIPVAHVEAGLRSGVLDSPFPEEANRKILSAIATLNFAPTAAAGKNLLDEGVSTERVIVTGNTGIDALLEVRARRPTARAEEILDLVGHRRLVIVTAHRRENWESGLTEIFSAVAELAANFPDCAFLVPLHRNPLVRASAHGLTDLSNKPGFTGRMIITDPIDYLDFVPLLDAAALILTDSGGLQEEAPALGTPVLVLRDDTERPEGIAAGTARLVGPHREAIIDHASELLSNSEAHAAMVTNGSPYGDGRASGRIASQLKQNQRSR